MYLKVISFMLVVLHVSVGYGADARRNSAMDFSSPLMVFASINANRTENTVQEHPPESITKDIEFSTPKKGLIRQHHNQSEHSTPSQRMVVLPVPVEVLDQLYADVLPFYEINIRLVPDPEETAARKRIHVPTAQKTASPSTVAASSPTTSSASLPSMSFTVPTSQFVAGDERREAGDERRVALQPKAPIVDLNAPVTKERTVLQESAVPTVMREPLQPRISVSTEPVATDLIPSSGPAPLPVKIVLTPRQSEPSATLTPNPTPIPTKIASRSNTTPPVASHLIDANKGYSQVEFNSETRLETKPVASTAPEKETQVRPEPIVFAPTPIPIKIASPSQPTQKQPSLQGTENSAPESASFSHKQKENDSAQIATLFTVPTTIEEFVVPVVTPVSAEVVVRPAVPVPTMRHARVFEPEPLEPERLALDPSDLLQEQQEESRPYKKNVSKSGSNEKGNGKTSDYLTSVTGLFKKFDNAKGNRWSSTSQTEEKTEMPNPYLLGLEAERRQDFVLAAKMYKKFIKDNRIDAGREKEVESNSMLAAPYHRLAMISWRLQEMDHADFYFQQASGFATGRNQFVVADDYAQFLISQGDHNRAEVVVRNFLIAYPKNTEFHAKLGQCLAMQDRPVESLRHYKVAYSEDRAYYEVAKVYHDKRDYSMARVMDERRQRYIAENRIVNPYRPDFGPANLPQYAVRSTGEMSPYSPPPIMPYVEKVPNRDYRPVTFVEPTSP